MEFNLSFLCVFFVCFLFEMQKNLSFFSAKGLENEKKSVFTDYKIE